MTGNTGKTTAMSSLTIKAEMARRGLLPNQLMPYWSADDERKVDPLTTPDVQREVRGFMSWLTERLVP